MARPKKSGLDYFPHDTDAHSDDKIQSLMALHGSEGYCFYFIMLEKVFRSENGKITIGNISEKAGLARSMSLSLDKFDKILKTSLELNCFNPEIYAQENALTSNGITKRIASVSLLRDKDRERKNKDKYKRKGKAKHGKPPEKPTENPQLTDIKRKFLRYVFLTSAENDALLGKLKHHKDEYIERLDGYIAQIGVNVASKRYKSHYDTILNWHRKDLKDGRILPEETKITVKRDMGDVMREAQREVENVG